ncbi:4816_t:CDS:10 [Ambispora gerdemannii]|uniref:4816_t:CDS:1 n=1 Tax=Ambispora gerdemannii TaxID=144530 RepID=A0A9N9FML4_9GLOM|nr:4816_t:CDS:10 [Ambispora gerdemannii]
MSIDKKLIETDYDLTLADEVTQQMKTYARSTTTRVTKRLLDSRETSFPKRSTRTKWNIEGDESKTQTYQEIIDVGNNPFLVTEHIKEDELDLILHQHICKHVEYLKYFERSRNGDSPTSTIPTTPPPPSSHNYKQPRFITNNEYMDIAWSPWQFDAIICEIDIEEKLIGLCEKEKKAKVKSSLSYGIVDLNDSRIMDVLGQPVKFYFEAEMKKYKPQRAVAEDALETLKCLNVTSLSELGKALSSITINYEIQIEIQYICVICLRNYSSELQEGWYNSNIVTPFFDDCLASLSNCILRRGEVASKAQKLLGIKSSKAPKYDGVLSFNRKIEFIYVETATTSILSKRYKDLSKLHEAIAIMFKLIVSSLPEKIVYEVSDLPILCIQFCGTTADVYLANWPVKMRPVVFSIMEFDIPEQVTSLPSLTKSAVRMLTLRSLIQDLHKRYQSLLKKITDNYLDYDNTWTSPLKLKTR